MLGWAIKKGFQGAIGAQDAPPAAASDDTTQIEAPDTPAPVFAARAFKNAIFGASAPAQEQAAAAPPANRPRAEAATSNPTAAPANQQSPSKPTSILLTPGTATARRKRVSFGHDVKTASTSDQSALAFNPDGSRKRTTLQQALENSRSSKSAKSPKNPEAKPAPPDAAEEQSSEGEWEDDDDVCDHDVTVDLNEPHSNSGKYWKTEFNKYHEEAKAEMEKLVRYKHMAKSYAKKKDAEAIDLSQRLKDEQQKVAGMESKITEMAAQVASKRKQGAEGDSAALIKDLAKQTSLAVQYRDQVKQLEAVVKGQDKDEDELDTRRRLVNTSPRTEKTLLDVNRELRRARSELKQMDSLRDESERLKDQVKTLTEENKRLGSAAPDASKLERLEKQLREAKDESRQKDSELRKLKRDYESLKRDAKSRTVEAMQVLQEKNDKITELEKQVAELSAAPKVSSRPKSFDATVSRHDRATREFQDDLDSLREPVPAHTNNHAQSRVARRSYSTRDLRTERTQSEINSRHPRNASPAKPANDLQAISDWTASSLEMDQEFGRDRKPGTAARKPDHAIATTLESLDARPAHAISQSHASRTSGDRGVMTDRINESSRDTRENHVALAATAAPASDSYYQDKINRRIASQRAARLAQEGRSTGPPPSEAPAAPAPAPAAAHDSPGFDLVQNRFARLGGEAPAERSALGNPTRADRQAAARARVEQKRLERQREKAAGRLLDKENLVP